MVGAFDTYQHLPLIEMCHFNIVTDYESVILLRRELKSSEERTALEFPVLCCLLVELSIQKTPKPLSSNKEEPLSSFFSHGNLAMCKAMWSLL
jgi:hypothetical protein